MSTAVGPREISTNPDEFSAGLRLLGLATLTAVAFTRNDLEAKPNLARKEVVEEIATLAGVELSAASMVFERVMPSDRELAALHLSSMGVPVENYLALAGSGSNSNPVSEAKGLNVPDTMPEDPNFRAAISWLEHRWDDDVVVRLVFPIFTHALSELVTQSTSGNA